MGICGCTAKNIRKESQSVIHLPAAAAKLLQSRPTLRPHRRSPLGSSVPGILQERILEWVAI